MRPACLPRFLTAGTVAALCAPRSAARRHVAAQAAIRNTANSTGEAATGTSRRQDAVLQVRAPCDVAAFVLHSTRSATIQAWISMHCLLGLRGWERWAVRSSLSSTAYFPDIGRTVLPARPYRAPHAPRACGCQALRLDLAKKEREVEMLRVAIAQESLTEGDDIRDDERPDFGFYTQISGVYINGGAPAAPSGAALVHCIRSAPDDKYLATGCAPRARRATRRTGGSATELFQPCDADVPTGVPSLYRTGSQDA